MVKLKAEKASLGSSFANLFKEKETFTQLQKDVKSLNDNKVVLERDISVMVKHKQDLYGKIEGLEKKLSDFEELEAKHHSLSADIQQIESKINSYHAQLDVFHSFLGFIKTSSFDEIDNFVSQLPHLLADIRHKNYSPELLRKYILETLSGRTLRLSQCTSCNARFIVDKPSTHSLGYYCPVCFSTLVKVVKDEAKILKAALAEQPPKRMIPRHIDSQDRLPSLTLRKRGQINS